MYEGDSSIARQDAYLNNGDAHSLIVSRVAAAYKSTAEATGDSSRGPDRYTIDSLAQDFVTKADYSEKNNAYYFAPPFSTTLVTPAAYNFILNCMSNHTAEEPNGYLNGEMFKQFFGVEGDSPDNFKWLPGQGRIPENWYRRTSTNHYNAAKVFTDVIPTFLAYPDAFRLGGNTNGVNTYAGVSLTDFTGGAYNLSNLLSFENNKPDGSYAACFFASAVQQGIPGFANLPLAQLSPITDLLNNFIKPIIPEGFDCPEADKFDQTL